MPDPHPYLESVFEMRIPDADPGDQNHADADRQHCKWGDIKRKLKKKREDKRLEGEVKLTELKEPVPQLARLTGGTPHLVGGRGRHRPRSVNTVTVLNTHFYSVFVTRTHINAPLHLSKNEFIVLLSRYAADILLSCNVRYSSLFSIHFTLILFLDFFSYSSYPIFIVPPFLCTPQSAIPSPPFDFPSFSHSPSPPAPQSRHIPGHIFQTIFLITTATKKR
jgi:hypothetical protein